jgi:argininosuccinate lyase
MTESNKMWGGRFAQQPSEIMQEINQSIVFDKRLYRQDIAGSIAHAKMLISTCIINKVEGEKIIAGLKQIQIEIEEGKFQFKKELEDIHMNIEHRLTEIIGDVAGKLHTARSRNDQVATDFKLFVRSEISDISGIIQTILITIVKKAEDNIEIIMPAFTHLQNAQPILFSHHMMAYFEMFKRDLSRLTDCNKRLNQSPLGSAALAGTSFPINRFQTAKDLGFDAPCANSMDGVSDRDFALEFLSTLSIMAVHLSRIGEEIVLWMSKGFDFISLPDSLTSGSSIMPQKKNPDGAELIRGKSGRVIGSLMTLLTVLKSLPLTYSKDMQEDKEPVFDAVENIKKCLIITNAMIAEMQIKAKNMKKIAEAGFSTATDLADWLVINLQIPFRQAHHITGQIVKLAEENDCFLEEISLDDLQKIEPKINKGVYEVLSVENSVRNKISFGSTGNNCVAEAIKNAKGFLAIYLKHFKT